MSFVGTLTSLALGHVPPPIPTFFQLTFRAAKSLTVNFVRLPPQTYLYFATAAAVDCSQLDEPVHCVISCHFVCNKKFHVVLCPLVPDHGDATARVAIQR